MSKIRNGFVTNSSSSSFIVAFNEIPKTIMDVRRELFDDNQMVFAMTYDNEPIGCDDAAQNVFNQMIDKKPNNLKEIKEALQGYLADAPDHYAMTKGFEYGSPEYKEAEAEYDRADKKFRAALLKRFRKTCCSRSGSASVSMASSGRS